MHNNLDGIRTQEFKNKVLLILLTDTRYYMQHSKDRVQANRFAGHLLAGVNDINNIIYGNAGLSNICGQNNLWRNDIKENYKSENIFLFYT